MNGYDLRREKRKVRESIGIVFQDEVLDGDLTVWETLEFHARVREGFLVQAREEPGLFLVIDGTRRPEEVFQDVLAGLALRFPDLSHLFLKG